MVFKIDDGSAQIAREKKWHLWFAWYPVRISSTEVVWLETIKRKRGYFYEYWEYEKLYVDK